jgi:hypothetical protein
MNPLGPRILEILQASPDGHSTAFNVFSVLNRNGYNVTKHEFEAACTQLHSSTSIHYWPVPCSFIDIPIGTLDLLTTSPAECLLSPDAEFALATETLSEASLMGVATAEEIGHPMEFELPPIGATRRRAKPSAPRKQVRSPLFQAPLIYIHARQWARALFGSPVFLKFHPRF